MTAGRIILDMPNPALDRNGDPMPGAKLRFTLAGTSINQDVFTDDTLTTPLSNPVVADGAGRFVEIWGDAAILYDAKWRDADNNLIYTFDNIAPVVGHAVDGEGGGITDPAAFRDALGLGSAAIEDAGASGHDLPFLDGDNAWTGANNFTDQLNFDGKAVGYLRVIPNEQDVDYTFVLEDRGKGIWHDSASNHTYLIPLFADEPFQKGDTIYLRSMNTGIVTIMRSTGVVLRKSGSATDADVALGSYGSATLICDAQDVWHVGGVGLT